MTMMSGGGHFDMGIHFTEDISYEDPFMRLQGWEEEYKHVFVTVCRSYIEGIEFDIHSEQHNEEQALLDMTMTVKPAWLPPFPMPLRAHIYFEVEEGSGPRIYKI